MTSDEIYDKRCKVLNRGIDISYHIGDMAMHRSVFTNILVNMSIGRQKSPYKKADT